MSQHLFNDLIRSLCLHVWLIRDRLFPLHQTCIHVQALVLTQRAGCAPSSLVNPGGARDTPLYPLRFVQERRLAKPPVQARPSRLLPSRALWGRGPHPPLPLGSWRHSCSPSSTHFSPPFFSLPLSLSSSLFMSLFTPSPQLCAGSL